MRWCRTERTTCLLAHRTRARLKVRAGSHGARFNSPVFILICVWTETCSGFMCANTSNWCLHLTLKVHPFMVTSVFSHRTRIRDLYVPSRFNFKIYFCFRMNFYTISTFISMLHLFTCLQTLRAQLSVKLPGHECALLHQRHVQSTHATRHKRMLIFSLAHTLISMLRSAG